MTSSTNEDKPGLKVGTRTEFLAIGDVIPGKEDALRKQLAHHRSDPNITEAINEIGTLHEARFVMLDGPNGRKQLMFASSFDGPWDVYIDDFARTGVGVAFDETWQYVEGYPSVKSPHIKEWFKEHTVVAGNFVLAYPEPSVKEVLRALAVSEAFQRVLDDPAAEDALAHPALKPLLEQAAN
jgi:hypothetical protein